MGLDWKPDCEQLRKDEMYSPPEERNKKYPGFDFQSNRVTLKMDVSHTEHSHVIGKGGNNIKKVMEVTGCHIHFPDSNRNNQAEKSNQVGILSASLEPRDRAPTLMKTGIVS